MGDTSMLLKPVSTIRDALPLDLAEQARGLFLAADFPHQLYADAQYYANQFADGGFGIPTPDELYQTDFHKLDGFPGVREILFDHVFPLVRKYTGRSITKGRNFYYKLHAGGHLRLHKDNYAGHTGFVWHLSKDWKWDWGGLMIAIDGEQASATLPVFNTLVIIDHERAVPHLVTQVAPWAREPRMMVTGIMQ